MYHSLTIGDMNTWEDWRLIPTSRPVINPPNVKTKYIDIPLLDGEIDVASLFTGRPSFSNRVGSVAFIVDNDFLPWEVLYSKISNYLHGNFFKMILEDDPVYFYEGRFSVNEWKSDKNFSTIVIDYNVGPYKKRVNGTVDDWLWDPFDFEDGYIYDLRDLEVSGNDSLTVIIYGDKQPISPYFITTASMEVKYKGVSYTLPLGQSKVPDISLGDGEHQLIFSGSGEVTIVYRGASL